MEEVKFECRECGGGELAYQKGVMCIMPVVILADGHMEYGQLENGNDDEFCLDNGYICMDCEKLLYHCGHGIRTEKELFDYLTMDPVVREKEQTEYDESLKAQKYNHDEQDDVDYWYDDDLGDDYYEDLGQLG